MSGKPKFDPKKPFDRLQWAYRMGREHALTPSARAVLVYLAHRWNQAKGRAWPSQETIAADTGLSLRTVRTSVWKMSELGIVSIYHPEGRREGTGGRFSNEYWLNFSEASRKKRRSKQSPDTGAPGDDHEATGATMRQPEVGHEATIAPQQEHEQGIDFQQPDFNKSAPASAGVLRKPSEKQAFNLGRKLLGPNAGGLIAKLIGSIGVDSAIGELSGLLESYGDFYVNSEVHDEARHWIGSLIEHGK